MREAFKRPELDEVKIHIKAKKPQWTDEFITYYAERFWNFYQSNGWKVSGRAAMKDWRAAFASQWQTLKFKEDIEFFNKCQPKKQAPASLNGNMDKNIEFLDGLLEEYKKHPTWISQERLASCYDYLKQNGVMKLEKEQREIAIQRFNEDQMNGKAVAVQFLFENLANRGFTFGQILAKQAQK